MTDLALASPFATTTSLKLHIGGIEPRDGWTILNAQSGPDVDFVGDCTDLSMFADASADEVYASHVLEHLGYQADLVTTLRGIRRILRPGGTFYLSVPDLDILCRLFSRKDLGLQERFHLMRVIYGGQCDAYDFHKVGFSWDILCCFLNSAGFRSVQRVARHGLFADTSNLCLFGAPISLNAVARA